MVTESVEGILRPLAELRCFYPHKATDPELDLDASLDAKCPECHGTFRHPRFEALRQWHSDQAPCRDGCLGFSINASLEAMRKAMVACGWNQLLITTYGEVVVAEVCASGQSQMAGAGKGSTDAEAAARALVAAVNRVLVSDGKARVSTGPHHDNRKEADE